MTEHKTKLSEQGKSIFLINLIERDIRRKNKEIRRFKPKVVKFARQYKRYADEMEVKQKTVRLLTTKRDELLLQFQGAVKEL